MTLDTTKGNILNKLPSNTSIAGDWMAEFEEENILK